MKRCKIKRQGSFRCIKIVSHTSRFLPFFRVATTRLDFSMMLRCFEYKRLQSCKSILSTRFFLVVILLSTPLLNRNCIRQFSDLSRSIEGVSSTSLQHIALEQGIVSKTSLYQRKKISNPLSCETTLVPSKSSGLNGLDRMRFTESLFKKYIHSLENWEGWMNPPSVFFAGFLTHIQHNLGIVGPVGEIGVHHGKFAVVIAMFAFETERVWLADLFENQVENIDGSGKGDKDIVRKHLEEFGLDSTNTVIVSANSMSLSGYDLNEQGFTAFRFLSVDGGHTHELTLNDLLFSCEVIQDGSIVVLDDFLNIHWMGVASGFFHFLSSQTRLQPFLWASNKMYLTTPLFVHKYVQAIKRFNPLFCSNDMDVLNQRHVFPQKICISTWESSPFGDVFINSHKDILLQFGNYSLTEP